MQIDPNAVKWDDAPAIDPSSVKWDDEEKKAPKRTLSRSEMLREFLLPAQVRDFGAGLLRGAGSIGATLMAPNDMLEDALEKRATGKDVGKSRNDIRREGITGGLQSMGANPESGYFTGGKLAGEISGTLGVGGAVGGLAGKALPAGAAPLVQAIETAGMRAGGLKGPAALATRMAGGAITGGASAGLVNPEDAQAGATIGGLLPPAVQVAGKAGRAVGTALSGPARSADHIAGINSARQAGYVIPPTQAKASLGNRVLEGFAGKISTAQNASAKNQEVTAKLVAQELGLPQGAPITPQSLKAIRDSAGQAYAVVSGSGTVAAPAKYDQALDSIVAPYIKAAQGFPNAKPSPVIDLVESLRSPSFDAGSAVEKIKELRTAADDGFRTGNTDIARASKAAAKALEDAIEDHLQGIGAADLLDNFRNARQLIAKTYTVEKALNPTTGTIDAAKLGTELKRGKPLSGGIKAAADFANRFPKAAQTTERMGSLPQTSPLDWATLGTVSAMAQNPLPMLGVMARPMARGAALSPMVQNRLASGGVGGLLANPEMEQAVLRTAPLGLLYAQ
jgi:hypothetical protein